MDKQSFLLLVDKVVSGTATQEELALYNHYYNRLQEAGEDWDEEKLGKRDETGELVLRRIEKVIGFDKGSSRTLVLYRRTWAGVAAALLLALAGGWLLVNHYTLRKTPQSAENAGLATAEPVHPGSNQAVLTLAGGRKIVLNDTQNGRIAREGSTEVVKLDSGRLAYRSSMAGGQRQDVSMNILSTPYGGKYQATLPDGTGVWLNSGSTLKFPTAFTGGERKVELTGEAYFEVAGNPGKPFKVMVNGMEVAVLGTHFNIMGYEDEAEVKTSLLSGSVKVLHDGNAVLLQPGQQSQLNKAGQLTVINHANLGQAVAWKNGLFDFEGADIQAVMRQLARWYNVEVTYQSEIDQHFTGKIDRGVNIREVLEMLALTEKVHFNVEGRKVIVSR